MKRFQKALLMLAFVTLTFNTLTVFASARWIPAHRDPSNNAWISGHYNYTNTGNNNVWIPAHRAPNGAWIPGHYAGGPARMVRPGCHWVPGHRAPNGAWVPAQYFGPHC